MRIGIRQVAAGLVIGSLALSTAMAGPASQTPETIETRLADIQKQLDDRRFAPAETAARALLTYLDASESDETPEAARTIALLLQSLESQGRIGTEGVELARRGLRLRESLDGPDSLSCAVSLSTLGFWLRKTGKLREAKPLYERALVIRQKALKPDHPEIAKSLSNLAVVDEALGDWAAAGDGFERALGILESSVGLDSREAGVVVSNYGELLDWLGDFETQRNLFERRLATVRGKPGVGPEMAQVRLLSRIAESWANLGDPDAGRESFGKALALWTSLEPRVMKSETPGPLEVSNTLNRLAGTYEALGETAAAKETYLKAIGLKEAVQGPTHPDLSWPLRDLAMMLLAEGDAASARPYIDRACDLLNRAQDPTENLAYCLSIQGETWTRMGAARQALPLLSRSLEITSRIYGDAHPERSWVLTRMAAAELSLGQAEAGRRHALEAETIARRHFQKTASWLSEREALRFEQARATGLDLALSSLAGRAATEPEAPRSVADAVIRSRSLVLDELAARRRILSSASDPQITELAARLDSNRNRVARFIAVGGDDQPDGDYLATLRDMMEEKEKSERDLATRSVPFRQRLASWEVGLSAVRKALPAGSALVSYVKYKSSGSTPAYMALVTDSARETPVVVPLGEAGPIEDLVAAWRASVGRVPATSRGGIAASEKESRERGEMLRRAVWDPVAGRAGAAKMILVVPDGALHLINLGALPDRHGGYLVESETLIHYLSAERDLVRMTGRPEARGAGLLALGGPDYDGKPADRVDPVQLATKTARVRGSGTPRALASLRFEPLPASVEEVRQIDSLWNSSDDTVPARGGSTLLTGMAATEDAVKRLAAGRRIVHLATHGFFTPPQGPPSRHVDNPLLASGLALAGANARATAGPDQEDGLLLAEEIASRDLSGVEWVVLSACESALGDVREGEGVLGMRRAFEAAGAGTLIMSLWPIEDEATREWMLGLYRARLSGLSTAASMRRASVERIQSRRDRGLPTHPFYWGAFVAAGDWR